MDTVFNMHRFANLIKREFVLYNKSYIFLICGVAAYYVIAMLMDSVYSSQMLQVMPVVYFVLIIYVAPFLDKSLEDSNAVFSFSLPASTFERFLILWTKCVIVMPLLVLITSSFLDFVSSFFLETKPFLSEIDSLRSLHLLFAIQSLFFFGYVYFKKKAFVKTVMAIAIFFIVIVVVSKIIITQFHPEISHIRNSMDPLFVYDYSGYSIFADKSFTRVDTGTTILFDIAKYIIMTLFPLGMWVLSFFKLRETEI